MFGSARYSRLFSIIHSSDSSSSSKRLWDDKTFAEKITKFKPSNIPHLEEVVQCLVGNFKYYLSQLNGATDDEALEEFLYQHLEMLQNWADTGFENFKKAIPQAFEFIQGKTDIKDITDPDVLNLLGILYLQQHASENFYGLVWLRKITEFDPNGDMTTYRNLVKYFFDLFVEQDTSADTDFFTFPLLPKLNLSSDTVSDLKKLDLKLCTPQMGEHIFEKILQETRDNFTCLKHFPEVNVLLNMNEEFYSSHSRRSSASPSSSSSAASAGTSSSSSSSSSISKRFSTKLFGSPPSSGISHSKSADELQRSAVVINSGDTQKGFRLPGTRRAQSISQGANSVIAVGNNQFLTIK